MISVRDEVMSQIREITWNHIVDYMVCTKIREQMWNKVNAGLLPVNNILRNDVEADKMFMIGLGIDDDIS